MQPSAGAHWQPHSPLFPLKPYLSTTIALPQNGVLKSGTHWARNGSKVEYSSPHCAFGLGQVTGWDKQQWAFGKWVGVMDSRLYM